MVDQAGLVSSAGATGSTISLEGNLTESGFIGHRRIIENEHPLELDLLSAGLDLLPEYLQRWQRAKVRRMGGLDHGHSRYTPRKFVAIFV